MTKSKSQLQPVQGPGSPIYKFEDETMQIKLNNLISSRCNLERMLYISAAEFKGLLPGEIKRDESKVELKSENAEFQLANMKHPKLSWTFLYLVHPSTCKVALVAPQCYTCSTTVLHQSTHFDSLRLIPLWTSPETQTDYSQNGENFAGKWKITRSDEWLFSKKMINFYFDNFYETISLANPISMEPHEGFSFGFVSLAVLWSELWKF